MISILKGAARALAAFGILFALGAGFARADLLDLTYSGAQATGSALLGGTFIVQQMNQNPTGTGYIDPFLRIKMNGEESGFNTDNYVYGNNNSDPPLDALGGNWTRALYLSSIPIVTIGGVEYRQFMLDINESNGGTGPLLSLNQLQIFVGDNDPTAYTLTAATNTTAPIIGFSSATEVFTLNPTSPLTEIRLNYDLNAGSGWGDVYVYIPNADFAGYADTSNVILFSQFGRPPGVYSSSDGFEEWAVLTPVVPEPSTVMLFGVGLILVGAWYRRTRVR